MTLIQKLEQLDILATKSGKYLCPKCSQTRKNKKDPCLSVSFESEAVLYKCHNCDFTGIVKSNDLVFIDNRRKSYKKPQIKHYPNNSECLYEFAEKRGLNREIVKKYKITINHQKEIMFNYFRNDECVNVKYRSLDKKFRQEAGTEKIFYGIDQVPNNSKAITIVEGEFDCLALAMVGIPAISVPNGASENKLECIENCWEFLQKFDEYIICTDNDAAGDKLKQNLIIRLGKEKCKTVNWNLGEKLKAKDVNELLLKDKDALIYLINSAEYFPIEGVEPLCCEDDEFLDFWENGYESGLSTGWSNLDNIFKIKTGRLMVVTGIPTKGKSFFIDNLLFNLNRLHGWKHLMCSLETAKKTHISRFVSMRFKKDFRKGRNNSLTREEVKQGNKYVGENYYTFIINQSWSVDKIIEKADIVVRRYGLKTLVIDPYGRLDNTTDKNENHHITHILSRLIELAKRLDILVIFIAHPTKIPRDQDMPTLYNISGSSAWYNYCDYGVIVHRERDDASGELLNISKIAIQKVKDFELGNPSGGVVSLNFNYNHFILEEDNQWN